MTITDPITVEYNAKHNYWYLKRGVETFFDEERYMIVWDNPTEPVEWAKENYPNSTIIERSEQEKPCCAELTSSEVGKPKKRRQKVVSDQLSLPRLSTKE